MDKIFKALRAIRQILSPQQNKKPTHSTKLENQAVKPIIRIVEIIKPKKETRSDLITPTQYKITPQAAKSVLRRKKYIRIPPRDTYAPHGHGGDS